MEELVLFKMSSRGVKISKIFQAFSNSLVKAIHLLSSVTKSLFYNARNGYRVYINCLKITQHTAAKASYGIIMFPWTSLQIGGGGEGSPFCGRTLGIAAHHTWSQV